MDSEVPSPSGTRRRTILVFLGSVSRDSLSPSVSAPAHSRAFSASATVLRAHSALAGVIGLFVLARLAVSGKGRLRAFAHSGHSRSCLTHLPGNPTPSAWVY
jgi:hypothetical protein